VFAIVLDTRIKVRMFVRAHQFIPLSEFGCYIAAVVCPARFSSDPPLLIARGRRWSI
jgi:hypothetical protein